MNARRIVFLLLLLSLFAVPAPAESKGVRLQDPRDGQAVVVEPGARVLHLVFFATWCPACVDELPQLAELAARWANRDYRQVIVAIGARQSTERLIGFFADRQLSTELVFDAEGAAAARWSATRVPTHVLLDETGNELARGEALDAAIESAIGSALQRRRETGQRP